MSHISETQAPIVLQEEGEEYQGARSGSRVSVIEGYELWARTYDRDPNPLLALEERELEPLLPNLKGKTVIDVACGTGRWLAKLLSKGASSGSGLDWSSQMLARASTKPLVSGRLVKGNCVALPFRNAVADLVVCSFAVGHIPDLIALAREIARISRQPADLFLTDFHPLGYERGWRCAFRQGGEVVEIASLPRSVKDVCKAFELEGFELLRCHEPTLGDPEKPIFEQAGKRQHFESAREIPAVFICHFKLNSDKQGRAR